MIAIKFDKEKVGKCIDGYKDEHGKNPYLILSEKTFGLLKDENAFSLSINNDGICCSTHDVVTSIGIIPTNNINFDEMSIKINDNEFVNKNKKTKDYGTWHGAKILIDNSLPYGEVHVG